MTGEQLLKVTITLQCIDNEADKLTVAVYEDSDVVSFYLNALDEEPAVNLNFDGVDMLISFLRTHQDNYRKAHA